MTGVSEVMGESLRYTTEPQTFWFTHGTTCSVHNTTIINNSLLNNVWNGITLRDVKNCDIYYTSSARNGMHGFTLIHAQIH